MAFCKITISSDATDVYTTVKFTRITPKYKTNYSAQLERNYTTQKMKFSIKDFSSKYDQIRSFLLIWSHILKKSLMENFIVCAVLQKIYVDAILPNGQTNAGGQR